MAVNAVSPRTGLAALLLLAACHRAPEQPGTLSADDQRQLNEAAASLDANAVAANESSVR